MLATVLCALGSISEPISFKILAANIFLQVNIAGFSIINYVVLVDPITPLYVGVVNNVTLAYCLCCAGS